MGGNCTDKKALKKQNYVLQYLYILFAGKDCIRWNITIEYKANRIILRNNVSDARFTYVLLLLSRLLHLSHKISLLFLLPTLIRDNLPVSQ